MNRVSIDGIMCRVRTHVHKISKNIIASNGKFIQMIRFNIQVKERKNCNKS